MLWSLTPLRQSKTIWTWFWANSSRSSCLSRGLEHMTSRDSFSPQAPCDFGKEKFKTSSIKLLQFTSLSQLAWKPPLHLCKVTSPHNQSRLRRLVRTFTGGSSANWCSSSAARLCYSSAFSFMAVLHFRALRSKFVKDRDSEPAAVSRVAHAQEFFFTSTFTTLPHNNWERNVSLANSNFFISSLSSYREI